MELREAWQDFLTDYLGQKGYIKRDNIVKFWVQSVIGFLHTPTWLAEQFNRAVQGNSCNEKVPVEPAKRASEIAEHLLSEDQRAEFKEHLRLPQWALPRDGESEGTP